MRYPTRFFKYLSYPTVQNRNDFYHPELDVLRFVAFLAVFMHHALPRDARLYINHGLSPAATQWLLTAKEAGARRDSFNNLDEFPRGRKTRSGLPPSRLIRSLHPCCRDPQL